MRALSRVKNAYRRLLSFVEMYGQHLPLGFKMIFSMGCSVVLLRGTMKGGGSLMLLYAGRSGNYHYLLKTFFDQYEVVEKKRSTLMTIRRHMNQMEPSSDVVVMDVGWPYHGLLNRKGDFLELPDWANMALELSDSWEETVRSFRRTIRSNDLRYIRQNEYRCELTTDRRDIERFYDKMYLPFIQSRHGLDAVKAPRRHVIRRARQGCLQQIFKGDQVVSAGVVYPDKGVLYFLWMGMPAETLKEPPPAAISALYYFGIRHAFDHDLWAVDFMGTRTFLTDGAFQFKRKWGAVLEDTFSPNSILIKPKSGRMNAARFCQHFPMLARREGELEVLFLSIDETVDEKKLSRLDAQYGCNGISRMTVLDLSGHGDSGCGETAVGGHAFHLIKAGLDNFAEHYGRIGDECGENPS